MPGAGGEDNPWPKIKAGITVLASSKDGKTIAEK